MKNLINRLFPDRPRAINKFSSQGIGSRTNGMVFLFWAVLVFHVSMSGCAENPAQESSNAQETEPAMPAKPRKNVFSKTLSNTLIFTENMLVFNEHLKDLLIAKKNLKKGRGQLTAHPLAVEMERWPNMADHFDLSGFRDGAVFAYFIYENEEKVTFYFLAGALKDGRFLIREYQVHGDKSMEFLGEQFFDIPKPAPVGGKE